MITELQKTAIRRAGFLGKKLQQEFPEIVQARRLGKTYNEIVQEYNLTEKYPVTQAVAKMAVRYALEGYHHAAKEDSYKGLISDPKEYETLSATALQRGCRKGGGICRDTGRGLFSLSAEEQQEASRKGGQIRGKWRGREWALQQGFALWSAAEVQYVWSLAQQPAYRYGTHAQAAKIAQEVNAAFHQRQEVRSRGAISHKISKCRKLGLEKVLADYTETL